MHDPTFDIPEEKPEEIYPPCKKCYGTGYMVGFGNELIICDECEGKGYIEPEEDEEIPY